MSDTHAVGDAAALGELIQRYDAAWNAHDLDTILALHAPGMVFENYTAAERAEGDEVGPHIAVIFENWPDLAFQGRRQLVRDGVVVSELVFDRDAFLSAMRGEAESRRR